MSFKSNEGVDTLASVLVKQIDNQSVTDLVIDFGTIEADYSLKTNTFLKTIPKTDYLVCRSTCYGTLGTVLSVITGGNHNGHESGDGSHMHTVPIPEKLRTLLPGDRVLVAWVQNDAVVIDIIKPASEM